MGEFMSGLDWITSRMRPWFINGAKVASYCGLCGAIVGDEMKHAEWHYGQEEDYDDE